jgi:cell division protein FtsW
MVCARVDQAVPAQATSSLQQLAERFDVWLAGAALLLLAFGLIMIASASISIAEREFGAPLYFFWRQAAYAGIGLGLALSLTRIPVRYWHRCDKWILAMGALLLVAVLVPGLGKEINGSMRWFRFGGVSVQPSELVKLALIVYMAGYLVRRGDEVRTMLSGFFKPIGILAVLAALLLLEPDYGATVVLCATVLGMLFLGGVPLRIFFSWATVIAGIFAAILLVAPYRLERLSMFLDPWADPYGKGFQLTQALIAVGRGEWFGVGLGSSVQKLSYLPEAHTDFLFAVLAEELGLFGVVVVISLFVLVVSRAFMIGYRSEGKGRLFEAYLAYGVGLVVGLQAFINIGVNLGVLPTKGLTLPLMSYGGSSVVATCAAIGLLLRIDYETRYQISRAHARRQCQEIAVQKY